MNGYIQRILEQIKGMTPKEKAEYVFTYYWYHILGICAVVFFIIFIPVHFLFGNQKPVFSLAIVNQQIDYDRDQEAEEAFAKLLGVKKELVDVDSDYHISYTGHEFEDANAGIYEKFFLKWRNEELDAVIAAEDFLEYCQSVGGRFHPIGSFETEGYELYENGELSGICLKETDMILAFPAEGSHKEECQKFIDFIKSWEREGAGHEKTEH